MSDNKNAAPQAEISLPQADIVPQLEVIARSFDMIPDDSGLGQYLASNAKEIYKDAAGIARVRDTDHSEYDEIKEGIVSASSAFESGKVGDIRLISGTVNADYNTHKHSLNPNLRNAFEHLALFDITGSSDFHTMFNPSGETVGEVKIGAPNDEQINAANDAAYATAAAKILEGAPTVMLVDEKGRTTTKVYGMRDPQTGELLPNAFLTIHSGTYSDKEGSASPFSNMAFATIKLIPSENIESAKQPNIVENAEEAPFDIDQVDWSVFAGDFKVLRSDGNIDTTGWKLRSVEEEKGKHYAVLSGWDPAKGGPVTKSIWVEDLVKWQTLEQ
jgi:hypothetical protein